ncbi:nucleoside hydrolase [Komagataeibacter rhaeticus]|nr:nucleoside hydrolase [Komagataeibacter rhaeticus]
MPCSLIIDTDPGHDDAFAILLALASSNVTVLGLTAVAGNIPARMAAENARRIVELAGRAEVEVRTGADLPFSARPVTRMTFTARPALMAMTGPIRRRPRVGSMDPSGSFPQSASILPAPSPCWRLDL